MTKEERIKVFEETLACAKNWKYTNPDSGEATELFREDYNMHYEDSEIYNRNLFQKLDKKLFNRFEHTDVRVINKDCLYVAEELVNIEGLYPAVLNMASFKRPGGGVKTGSAAQEENLCRRTNLYPSIEKFADQKHKVHYPLDINFGAIYSPVVSVFRLSEETDYQFMILPFTVDVISCAAIKNPKLNADGTLEEKSRDILRNKIRTIFNVALYWKNDSLVLGAFGCGAYGTPPEEMAKLFKEVMSERPYKHAFKKIVFAILDDHNTHREHNPEGNFIPFKRILSQKED